MITMPDTRGKFFSVRFSTTIHGVKYTPAVCYKMTGSLQPVIEDMAKGDNPMARIYPEEVRFVSGAAYPVKKKGREMNVSVPPTTVIRSGGFQPVDARLSSASAPAGAGPVSKRAAKRRTFD